MQITFLKTTNFYGLKVKVSPPVSLNTDKGVGHCPDLKGLSDDEIRENLKQEGVLHIKDLMSNEMALYFNKPLCILVQCTKKCRPMSKLVFFDAKVDTYVPNPLRCYRCQQYGHHEIRCNRDPVCGNCAVGIAYNADRCANPTKCATRNEVPARGNANFGIEKGNSAN